MLTTHHYNAHIVGGRHWEWLEWRPTNSWLCHRNMTVVIEWQQNNFNYLNTTRSSN